MHRSMKSILLVATLAISATTASAQDYLTKDGKLTSPLKLFQLQGGFAGFTGIETTIQMDGSWTSEAVFQKKRTPKDKGQLSAKDLSALSELLTKYDLVKLPATSGKNPGANPHTLTLEFGTAKAVLTGTTRPTLDAADPTGTVESRFAGIWDGVERLISAKAP